MRIGCGDLPLSVYVLDQKHWQEEDISLGRHAINTWLLSIYSSMAIKESEEIYLIHQEYKFFWYHNNTCKWTKHPEDETLGNLDTSGWLPKYCNHFCYRF